MLRDWATAQLCSLVPPQSVSAIPWMTRTQHTILYYLVQVGMFSAINPGVWF